jgi:hypothetical protein
MGCQQSNEYKAYVLSSNSIQWGHWSMGCQQRTDMLRMFFEANKFDKDIGQWDVSNGWNVLCFLEQLNSAEI